MLSKDIVSNRRGEGTVAPEPESGECRTQLLRRAGERGLGRAFRDHKGNRSVWILEGHKESMQMEAVLAVLWQ